MATAINIILDIIVIALLLVTVFVVCAKATELITETSRGNAEMKSVQLGQAMLEEHIRSLQDYLQLQVPALRTDISSAMSAGFDRVIEEMRSGRGEDRGFVADVKVTLEKLTETVDGRLEKLQADNGARLDKIQGIVDEKLQKTLNDRLAASFSQVSEQLGIVSQGLGEMKSLAEDTRGLKAALTNVKSRGIYGEVRCEALLQDTLSPGQYVTNAEIQPGCRVEFAVKLPGNGDGPVLLPIDSKFPIEDYNRLLDAQEKSGIDAARRALAQKIRTFAKDVSEKYILPPMTTDFALMFLPTEGLYAEVVQNAALFEELRDKYHVTPVGMTTLTAFLSSLRIGFRTMAIEQKSKDIQAALSAVKTEVGKFGGMLEKAQKQIQQADQTLAALSGTRLNAISRKLRSFEELPEPEAERLLGGQEVSDA